MIKNSGQAYGKSVSRTSSNVRIWYSVIKSGFMKHLPNLLKQESSSAATLVHVLLRMYYDPRPDHLAARPQIADRLLPCARFYQWCGKQLTLRRLGLGVLQDYNKLKADTQSKNIAAWTPVVADILDGLSRLDDKAVGLFPSRSILGSYSIS